MLVPSSSWKDSREQWLKGSLRSIANNYDEDEVDSDDERVSRKKVKIVALEGENKDEEESDFNIVDSDDEDNSSGAGSAKNTVVISRPRVTQASRLVSYGGDEDEEEDPTKAKENVSKTEEEKTLPSEPLSKENEENSQNKTPTEETKSLSTSTSLAKDTDKEIIPKELHDHLAAVKAIHVTLPPDPDARCSNSLQEKIEKLLETKLRNGRDLKDTIQRKKNFRNPSIYEKLVSFCSINETGTNYPPHIYDPFSWTEESFYESLSKLQKEHHERSKQKERSKVEFVSATKKSVAADDAAKKRKSKWDVTSSGTAAVMTIPATALQSIASVQAVVAAKAKVISATATVKKL